MREHSINQLNNFISGYYPDSTDFCDDLIEIYQKAENKRQGTFNSGMLDLSKKESFDISLPEEDFTKYYADHIKKCLDNYVAKYGYSVHTAPFGITEPPNIQYYPAGGGFPMWHSERNGIIPPKGHRHLVFMTYLNDVKESGETEFFYQDIKIKPEKGLTIIWPPEWMFTHKGNRSSEEKYILTGWYSYINN